MASKQLLGEILLQSGLITDQQLQQALRMQVGGNRRLGHILVQMQAISSDQLLETLSRQLNLPIISIDQEVQASARGKIPRYLCQRYEVLPLATAGDNVLQLAMADPSDTEAITDIERYTGMAVQPCLARQQDIRAGIPRHVPFSLRDYLNPSNAPSYARAASILALILVAVVSVLTYRFYTETKYGTITRTNDTTIYKNHDLMVGFNQDGGATLLGRGSYATGYYSINFDSPQSLQEFIEHKKSDLSEEQYSWVQWTLHKRQH